VRRARRTRRTPSGLPPEAGGTCGRSPLGGFLPCAKSGRGWTRTSTLSFVRRALSAIELLAHRALGQGVEPRSPRSERGVLPVRRAQNAGRPQAMVGVCSCGGEADAFRDLPRPQGGDSSGGNSLGGFPLANKESVEPRSPRSERGVLPVRRSRKGGSRRPASPSIPRGGGSTQQARLVAELASYESLDRKSNDVFQATRLPFDPGSPATGLRNP
jgi:hypothetical protein